MGHVTLTSILHTEGYVCCQPHYTVLYKRRWNFWHKFNYSKERPEKIWRLQQHLYCFIHNWTATPTCFSLRLIKATNWNTFFCIWHMLLEFDLFIQDHRNGAVNYKICIIYANQTLRCCNWQCCVSYMSSISKAFQALGNIMSWWVCPT